MDMGLCSMVSLEPHLYECTVNRVDLILYRFTSVALGFLQFLQ